MFLRRRRHGCRVSEVTDRGHRVVILENELLRVAILPERGAEIVELRHKPTDLNPLWRSPWPAHPPTAPLQHQSTAASAFLDGYLGGWQELFPTCGDAATIHGAELGVHGEVTALPWRVDVEREDDAEVRVCFAVETVRTPFRLERRMSLRGGVATLFLNERASSFADRPLEVMWGHHPTFGAPFLQPGCRIESDARRIEVFDQHRHPDGHLPAQQGRWPRLRTHDGAELDVSQVGSPADSVHDWIYLSDFESGWLALRQPQGLGVALAWDTGIMPYLLMWRNYGGAKGAPWFGRAYTLGLEPHSGAPASFASAHPKRWLSPTEPLDFNLTATLFASQGPVRHVDPQGVVW
jgi:galactose mutarotase-like enzyme